MLLLYFCSGNPMTLMINRTRTSYDKAKFIKDFIEAAEALPVCSDTVLIPKTIRGFSGDETDSSNIIIFPNLDSTNFEKRLIEKAALVMRADTHIDYSIDLPTHTTRPEIVNVTATAVLTPSTTATLFEYYLKYIFEAFPNKSQEITCNSSGVNSLYVDLTFDSNDTLNGLLSRVRKLTSDLEYALNYFAPSISDCDSAIKRLSNSRHGSFKRVAKAPIEMELIDGAILAKKRREMLMQILANYEDLNNSYEYVKDKVETES